MEQAEFRDPRLVAVYDAEYGWSRTDEFFLGVANATPRVRVLDPGCGTAAALRDLHRALVPGGRLVFDSRDPRARAWDRWNLEDSRSVVVLPDRTEVEVSTEVTSPTWASAPSSSFVSRSPRWASRSRRRTEGGNGNRSERRTESFSCSPRADPGSTLATVRE